MARKARLHVPGGVYHAMLRGNDGQDIFFAKGDRRRFQDLIAEGTERFGYRVHGFCLMTNHVHLVLQIGDVPLSRAMHNLAFRHARFVNARRGRVGHLFEGRYKALLVEADSYLLELVRYVHLNPVRAGLVEDPADWPWSGHRAYLGREALPWLTTEWVLGQLGRRIGRARAAYDRFVGEGIGGDRRPEFHAGADDYRVLAGEEFLKTVLAPARPHAPPALEAIVAAVVADYDVAEAELAGPSRGRALSEARGVIALLARDTGAASLSTLAARWRRDVSTLSRNLSRLEARRAAEPDLARRVQRCNNTTIQA